MINTLKRAISFPLLVRFLIASNLFVLIVKYKTVSHQVPRGSETDPPLLDKVRICNLDVKCLLALASAVALLKADADNRKEEMRPRRSLTVALSALLNVAFHYVLVM